MDKEDINATQSAILTCPTTTPLPVEDSPPTTTLNSEEPKLENPEGNREAKRVKRCPSSKALESGEAIIKFCSKNSGFSSSFSFDPKFCSGVTTPEVTPKFGSFNLAAPAAADSENEDKIPEKKDDEVDGERLIHYQKRKIDELLEGVKGITSADAD